jgi:hypothetical protein
MIFFENVNKKKCEGCGYTLTYKDKLPEKCPQCDSPYNAIAFIKSSLEIEKKPKVSEDKLGDNYIPPPGTSDQFFNQALTDQNKNQRQNFKVKTKAPVFNTAAPPSEDYDQNASDFAKNITMKAKPDLIISDQVEPEKEQIEISQIKISKSSITSSDSRVKIKVKKKKTIDLTQEIIEIGELNEYLKFLGVVTKDRVELYSSNTKFKYLLELAGNLNYIATSILSGELDKMVLQSDDGKEEFCYFRSNAGIIYIIYGNLPDKKAEWLLNQMKKYMHELTMGVDFTSIEKLKLYNISQKFQKHAQFMLDEYIKLKDVFSKNKIESLDKYLRLDYLGLSFESVGVISKLITDELHFSDLPPMDPNDENALETLQELKESLITAKVEAIAANVNATTGKLPIWISVKLSFQHYRFLLFSKINSYYLSLLAEGTLELREKKFDELKVIFDEFTKKPFTGDLKMYSGATDQVIEYINQSNKDCCTD